MNYHCNVVIKKKKYTCGLLKSVMAVFGVYKRMCQNWCKKYG